MQARFYLPMYGRFASPDPARDQHFEATQSWNIYSYCMNNPVMKVDPSGMFWQELKNWWTGGGWKKNAEAEKVRMVRQVDWSSAEGRKLGVKPGNSAGLNKSGQVVRTWNSEGIHDDSGSLLMLAGGASLAKNLIKVGAESLTKEIAGKTVDELLKPGGELLGTVSKGATPNIRTVPSGEFATLQDQLLSGAKPSGTYAGGNGTWYDLASGGRVGVRTSTDSGVTLDINIPGYPKGFKVHQSE